MFGWIDYILSELWYDYVLCLVDNMWLCAMFGWVDCISSEMWCDQLMKYINVMTDKRNVYYIWNTNEHNNPNMRSKCNLWHVTKPTNIIRQKKNDKLVLGPPNDDLALRQNHILRNNLELIFMCE